MKKTSVLCAGIAAVVLCVASTAQAGWPWGYGYFGSYNWGFQRYGLVNNQMPPYFAMFPPVYYRAPIEARTYGTSPFAYPPCNCRPTVAVAPQPEVIDNPYVKPDSNAKPMPKPKASASGKTARVQPQVIINPYVTDGRETAVARK